MLDELGSKYIIIDYEMATYKYYAMVIFADKSPFFDVYYKETTLEWVEYYYPEYYNSMCSRLYNFGGGAVDSDSGQAYVISYEDRKITDPETGKTYWIKVVTSEATYGELPTYEEAKAYEEAHPGQRIVGKSPWVSCISLEPLEHYELIHQSETAVIGFKDGRIISYVEIFEYVP